MPNFIGNTTEYPVVTPANVDTVPLVQGGVLKQATTLAIGDVAVAVHEAADDPHPQYAQGASIAGLPSVTAAADDVLLIGRVSTTVTYTATTLSTLALDNSYNDSAGQFVAEGFTVGMDVKVTGFTGNVANNIFSAQITALTASKMTIGGTDGDVIVDDAAGESVTITGWECVRGTAQGIADLTGDADLVTYTPTTLADWDGASDPGDVEQALDQLAERVTDVEGAIGGAVDADDVTYTPTTLADWDGAADPGDVEQALDQLAERTADLEAGGGGDASTVTYTPAVTADWDGTTDPGNVDDALDQLAERVNDIEALPGGGGMSAAEEEHWHKLAALLDPDAYVYVNGSSFTFTVPANKVFYLVSAWQARLGSTGNTFFLRDPRQPMPMLPGFNLQGNGTSGAHAYYCDPSLVSYADPKEKYFERLASLVDLQQYVLGATISAGAAHGTLASAFFPTDFTNGLLLAAQSFDVSWVTLGTAGSAVINLDDEISDDHQNRAAGGMMHFLLPFKRTTFDGIRTRGGNVAGATSATTTIAGNASISYVKTPVGW
jgi:hypothetical protein